MKQPLQKRSQQTLDAIYDAVAKLLAKKNFTSITIQEIAQEAKMTPSLIYTRFENKSEIESVFILRFFKIYIQELEEEWERRASKASSSETLLSVSVSTFIDISLKHKAILRAIGGLQINNNVEFSNDILALIEKRSSLIESWIKKAFSTTTFKKQKIHFVVASIVFQAYAFVLFSTARRYMEIEVFKVELTKTFQLYLSEKS